MISLIEAMNFRCLRYIKQPLSNFHVLVGPNASGKTTFLDVVAFLRDLISEGLESAIGKRTSNFMDLLWGRSGKKFELAVEARIPEGLRESLREKEFDTVRYEISFNSDTEEILIETEKVLLKKSLTSSVESRQIKTFPALREIPETIITPPGRKDVQTIIRKAPGGNDIFYPEVNPEKRKGWAPTFKLGPRKSALSNLPADESKFPVSTWFRKMLTEGVQQFILNSLLIRKASPPGYVRGFKPDGSNLPWVIDYLQKNYKNSFKDWIEHLKTALPDLENIQIIEREDDKHRYLMLCYKGGLKVPSWMASDGTLRLLALTLLAYIPDFSGIYLIEEPENGIHPRAIETMFQSLSSVYNAQILLATHSSIIVSMAEVDDVLCFARTNEGATDIVTGKEHPALRDWKGETNLSILFAGGVLG